MSAGETDLGVLIASMEPELWQETFVFATVAPDASVPASTVMSFLEREGRTLILPEREAHAAGLTTAFPCRMITLNIHSSLEAVGFLAAITARLASAGMGVNPVSAFYHDHLFVPEARAGEAMALLRQLAAEAATTHE